MRFSKQMKKSHTQVCLVWKLSQDWNKSQLINETNGTGFEKKAQYQCGSNVIPSAKNKAMKSSDQLSCHTLSAPIHSTRFKCVVLQIKMNLILWLRVRLHFQTVNPAGNPLGQKSEVRNFHASIGTGAYHYTAECTHPYYYIYAPSDRMKSIQKKRRHCHNQFFDSFCPQFISIHYRCNNFNQWFFFLYKYEITKV